MSSQTPLERVATRLAEMDGYVSLDFGDAENWDTQAYIAKAKEVAKAMAYQDGNESESCWYCGRHIQERENTNA